MTAGHLRKEGKEAGRHGDGQDPRLLRRCRRNRRRDRLFRAALGEASHLRVVSRQARHADDKVVVTVDQHNNTSSTSAPLALSVAIKDGRIKRSDPAMVEAMGALPRGTVLIHW